MAKTKQYKIRYLPIFYEDLLDKTSYISEDLKNPKAAMDLAEVVEQAIYERSFYAESFEPYLGTKERELPYYPIYIKNYVVYYVVIDHKIMEVRRFLYKGQNRRKIL